MHEWHGHQICQCMAVKILAVVEMKMSLYKCPHTWHANESRWKTKQLNPFHEGLLKPSSTSIQSLVQICLCLHVTNPWCETDGNAYINHRPRLSFPWVPLCNLHWNNTLDKCSISCSGKGLCPKASRPALRIMRPPIRKFPTVIASRVRGVTGK
jgi:hypothetical protein